MPVRSDGRGEQAEGEKEEGEELDETALPIAFLPSLKLSFDREKMLLLPHHTVHLQLPLANVSPHQPLVENYSKIKGNFL